MKIFLTVIIGILFSVVTSAQITDSIPNLNQSGSVTKVVIDTLHIEQPIDSIKTIKLNDTLNVIMRIDSFGVYIVTDTIRRHTKIDSIKIRLNTLLKPYYNIQFDSTLNKDIYEPRFRMAIHNLTKDTTYIPIPKEKSYIVPIKRLQIDTLKIVNTIAQVKVKATKYADDPIWWEHKNSIGLDINEAAFLNWNAGGNNSISGLVKVDLVRSYKKLHVLWNNELFARYGLNQQQEKGLRKTEDRLEFNSTFGYRRDTISNWFYSVKMNFKTQFTDGYKYPKTSTPISRFFAPAYLFLGAGTHYENKKQNFSLYLSPVTLKSTFVLDNTLSNEGAFGVVKGENSRHQFGFLLESVFRKEVLKNVLMTNKLSMYTDYLKDFGNIDVNWELNFGLKINRYIRASIGTHLIYDDDIKFKDDIDNDGTLETLGARVQLKQLLSIGVLYRF